MVTRRYLPFLFCRAVLEEGGTAASDRFASGCVNRDRIFSDAQRSGIARGPTASPSIRAALPDASASESPREFACPPQGGRRILSALAACLALSYCAPVAHAQAAPVFPISSVIAEVKRELAAAQNVPGAAVDLKLEKVEATLAVSRVVDANGKVSVGVPALGVEVGAAGTRKAEDSSTLYVELVPPEPGRALAATETKNFGLTEAIVDTRRELAKGLRDEPRLDPKKVVITVKFGVTQGAGPTGQLKLVVLTVGGGVSVASSDVSTIVLTFAANPGRASTAPQKQ